MSPRQATVSFAYCSWCKRFTGTARLVQLTDQGSGHGGRGHFACASCRGAYNLVPLADRPL